MIGNVANPYHPTQIINKMNLVIKRLVLFVNLEEFNSTYVPLRSLQKCLLPGKWETSSAEIYDQVCLSGDL